MILFILGITLMIVGLTWMRLFLSRLFKHRLSACLASLADSPYRGFLLGIVGAILLQGSTAVSLLAIALVSSGILTFPQSVAILLGANIGTCSTVPLLLAIPTVDLTPFRAYLFALLAVGLILRRTRPFAGAVGGLCMMLEGFSLLRTASASLVRFGDILTFLQSSDASPLIGIAGGLLLTFALQSASSATLVLTTLCDEQVLPLITACYMIYGNNIGSCLSSVLVSTAAPHEAKMTAMANLVLNIGGVLLFLPLTAPFLYLAEVVCSSTEESLIFLHTAFNIITALILLPFTREYAGFIHYLCRRK